MEELLLAQLQEVADKAVLGMEEKPKSLAIGWVEVGGKTLPTLSIEFAR